MTAVLEAHDLTRPTSAATAGLSTFLMGVDIALARREMVGRGWRERGGQEHECCTVRSARQTDAWIRSDWWGAA
jgi:hypothetical protein